MKIVKRLIFLLAALIVFAGFTYPFYIVPNNFENKARALTEERLSSESSQIDGKYVDESIRRAVTDNLTDIEKTSFIIASVAALCLFCITLRAPHDRGGFNLFNPIGLAFTAVVSILAVMTLRSVSHSFPALAGGLEVFASTTYKALVLGGSRLFCIVLIPLVLEAVFRGIIYSFLDKANRVLALILSPAMYAAAMYFIVGRFEKWVPGAEGAAQAALYAALFIGVIHTLLTWQLHSVFPAMISHIIIAFFAVAAPGAGIPYPYILAGLAVVLALFIVCHSLLSRKRSWLAYDFPLTKHHAFMRAWNSAHADVFMLDPEPAAAPENEPAQEEPAPVDATVTVEAARAEAQAAEKTAAKPETEKPAEEAEKPAEEAEKPAEKPAKKKRGKKNREKRENAAKAAEAAAAAEAEAEPTVTVEAAADEAVEAVETEANEAVETIEAEANEAAEAVETEVNEAAEAVETEVNEAVEAVETEVNEAAEAVETEVNEAAEAVETEVNEAAEAVETEVNEAAEAVESNG